MTERDAEPRWLSEDEQRTWRALNGLTILLPYALDAQMQRDHGISHFEYAVLSRLSESEGHTLRMKTLAAVTNGSLSRLSHVVARMEQRGWVVREPLPGDGRTTMARLTGSGFDKIVSAAPSHVETVRRLVLDPLDADQRAVLGTIARLLLTSVADYCDLPADLIPGNDCPKSTAPDTSAEPTGADAEPTD